MSELRYVEAEAHAVVTSCDTLKPEASTLLFSCATSAAFTNG